MEFIFWLSEHENKYKYKTEFAFNILSELKILFDFVYIKNVANILISLSN